MKKILFVLSLLFTLCLGANAQKGNYYKCTGNNLTVRVAANPKAKVVDEEYGGLYLDKGKVVFAVSSQKNGYIKVEIPWFDDEPSYGWVSAKYLQRVYECKSCGGTGQSKSLCKECRGDGCDACHNYSGHGHCKSCGGQGYR